MLLIGELSKISQVTVKSIRYYQDLGLISPIKTDPITNYRYYDNSSYERLNAILPLKDLGFSLIEIKSIFNQCKDETELKSFILKKLDEVKNKVKKLKDIEVKLKTFNSRLEENDFEIEKNIKEIQIHIPYVAKVKIFGKYEDIGKGFRSIYKEAGKYVSGSPYAFFYDMEYKDENPNFCGAMELRKKIKGKNIIVETLVCKKAVKLLYKGPYGRQGNAYLKLFNYCQEKGYKVKLPIIEHYIKGPGFIFKGNPDNYITECILVIE